MKKKMTEKQDMAMDKKMGIPEGSRKDAMMDNKNGVSDKSAKYGKRK